jgi:hypothetical protein
MAMNILEQILDQHPDDEFLKADGLDDAVIGYCGESMRLIYSVSTIMAILSQEMNHEDAISHLYHNILGSYVGDNTPIFCHDEY